MAKIKKGKAKGAEQAASAKAQPVVQQASVPQVVPLHPSAAVHDAHAPSSSAHEDNVHGS